MSLTKRLIYKLIPHSIMARVTLVLFVGIRHQLCRLQNHGPHQALQIRYSLLHHFLVLISTMHETNVLLTSKVSTSIQLSNNRVNNWQCLTSIILLSRETP